MGIKDNVVRTLIISGNVAVIGEAGSALSLIVVEIVVKIILIICALDNRLVNTVGDTHISDSVGVNGKKLLRSGKYRQGNALLGSCLNIFRRLCLRRQLI